MQFIVNKLLLIGALGLILSACSSAADTEVDSENINEQNVVEITDEIEESEEKNILADDIKKTFYPETTRLRVLSEKDLEWYDIIMTRLNAIDDFSGDRETVYEIAAEYGEDPEELWFNWLEIVDAKWYGDYGNYVILPKDFDKLTNEIIEKNIVGDNIEYMDSGFSLDEESLTSYARQELYIDGEAHMISFVIEHRDDFKIAEITKFRVDGEIIDL